MSVFKGKVRIVRIFTLLLEALCSLRLQNFFNRKMVLKARPQWVEKLHIILKPSFLIYSGKISASITAALQLKQTSEYYMPFFPEINAGFGTKSTFFEPKSCI